jgi:hypothetical protein
VRQLCADRCAPTDARRPMRAIALSTDFYLDSEMENH